MTARQSAPVPPENTLKVGETLGTTIILKSSERTTGWAVFDVPEDANITAATYRMDSTSVDDTRTGKWNLS
ncbi:hypothetical protein [Streptomyces sp. NPDC055140]